MVVQAVPVRPFPHPQGLQYEAMRRHGPVQRTGSLSNGRLFERSVFAFRFVPAYVSCVRTASFMHRPRTCPCSCRGERNRRTPVPVCTRKPSPSALRAVLTMGQSCPQVRFRGAAIVRTIANTIVTGDGKLLHFRFNYPLNSMPALVRSCVCVCVCVCLSLFAFASVAEVVRLSDACGCLRRSLSCVICCVHR